VDGPHLTLLPIEEIFDHVPETYVQRLHAAVTP
jgi:hypothetical protein